MNQISDRLKGLVQSDIRRMSRECERVGGINLGQGICDLPTIPELVEGACDAIASRTKRPTRNSKGSICCASASPARSSASTVSDSIRRRRSSSPSARRADSPPPRWPRSTPATKSSSSSPTTAITSTRSRFSESFRSSCRCALPTGRSTSMHCAPRSARRRAAIVVCTPSNPCGKVFTREELEKIGALCREFGAWAYTDEIYEYIVFDGRRHVSMASIDACRDVTITISRILEDVFHHRLADRLRSG